MARRPRVIPFAPRVRALSIEPLALRFSSPTTQVAVLPSVAKIENLTKFTAIVGVTLRSLSTAQYLLLKRVSVVGSTSPGWSLDVETDGSFRVAWQKATANQVYQTSDKPAANALGEPIWFVVTADQSGTATQQIQFWGGRLGDRVVPLTLNGSQTDGTGAYGTDVSVGLGLGNSTTPSSNKGINGGELWRVMLFDRVLSGDRIQDIIARPWDTDPGALVDMFPGESMFGVQDWGRTRGKAVMTAAPFPVNGPRLLRVQGSVAHRAAASPASVITTAPSSTVDALAIMSPSPVITQTTNGVTTDTGFTGNVVASIASGIGMIYAGGTVAAVAGVGTFPGLKVVGSGNITLAFTAAGYAPVISGPIAINQFLDRTETYPTFTPLNSSAVPGGTWGHKVFIPANYDGSAFPVLIAWHGSGSNYTPTHLVLGDQMTDGIAPTVIANKGSWPLVTIFPQYKTTGTTAPAGSPGGNAITWGGVALWLARLTTDGITYDANRVYGYGFSEGGNMITEEVILNPTIFAALVLPSTYINPVRLNAIIAGGLPGYTGLSNTTTDFTKAADYFLSIAPTMPIQMYIGTTDTGSIGTPAPISNIAASGPVQSGELAADPNFIYTSESLQGHVATEGIANLRYATPTSVDMLWLLAQHLAAAGGTAVYSPRGRFASQGLIASRPFTRRIA